MAVGAVISNVKVLGTTLKSLCTGLMIETLEHSHSISIKSTYSSACSGLACSLVKFKQISNCKEQSK